MPKITNESNIEEKLKYIGLNLEKIPKFLKEYTNLEYKPLKAYEENSYKVYRYVPISKIQILLTPTNRLNTLKEKYTKASPISVYLEPENEEDIIKHTVFLKMLKHVQISEIEKIAEEQKNLNKQIPFKVKFEENYLWQIYYSENSDTYFMLVPTEDLEYASFFYLLKKQIEYHKTKKEEMIFVPICYENYSGQYLKPSEIADIEKYLWFFTKNWCNIYEVYNKDESLNIVIVGDTIVYDDMVSCYRNVLKTKEDAIKFYKLLKALFILATELPHHYQFVVKLNRYGSLEFEYNQKKVHYDDIVEFLNKEYTKFKENIVILQDKEENLQKELKQLKEIETKKDSEYFIKEKQIATYLECRKTFFGRVKYFFKAKKRKKNKTEEVIAQEDDTYEKIENVSNIEFLEKEYYTIEDVVKICQELDNINTNVQNLEQDIKALKNKIEKVETKIKNANLYIEEIDTHEKNIFEFWKFTNKDENLLLNEAILQEDTINKKIEKVYQYKEDLEEIGNLIDKEQRKIFNKKDFDSIYILTTELFDVIKNIDDKEILEESLEKLKKEQETIFNTDKMDIFGNMVEDHTKIRMLGKNKHREAKKEKQKILDITKNTSIDEYKENLTKIIDNIKNCIKKAKSPLSIPIYIASKEKNSISNLQIFSINPEEIIKKFDDQKELYMYKINLKENSNVIYFSNSIFYDNSNQTLPLGMDLGTEGIIDINEYNLKQVRKDEFRLCNLQNEFKVETKKIHVYEYDILEDKDD